MIKSSQAQQWYVRRPNSLGHVPRRLTPTVAGNPSVPTSADDQRRPEPSGADRVTTEASRRSRRSALRYRWVYGSSNTHLDRRYVLLHLVLPRSGRAWRTASWVLGPHSYDGSGVRRLPGADASGPSPPISVVTGALWRNAAASVDRARLPGTELRSARACARRLKILCGPDCPMSPRADQ